MDQAAAISISISTHILISISISYFCTGRTLCTSRTRTLPAALGVRASAAPLTACGARSYAARLMDHLLQFFEYSHLPAHLQAISKPFCDLAHQLAATLPENEESVSMLRWLLLAKDAGVRAVLSRPVPIAYRVPAAHLPVAATAAASEETRKATEVASEMAALRAGTTSVKATHPRELARLAEEVELKARQADAYARAEQQPAAQPATTPQGSSSE